MGNNRQTRLIPLTQGKSAIVDKGDFSYLSQWKWHTVNKSQKWYAVRKQYIGVINGKYKYETIYMHRLLMDNPFEKEVDHKNGNSLDNQRDNLRICTHMQNLQNRPVRSIAQSGYKGVTWDKKLNKWFARITANNQNIHLGYFDNREAAAKEYNLAAVKYHGEFARLNHV